jgi:hypothetical protein
MHTGYSSNRQTGTPPSHQNYIDWMKAVGMFFIVFGHLVGPPFNQFTQPIYPKQLGVAFFVFIAAWGLANDSRPRLRVLFNRLFPVYLFGIAIALAQSVLFLFTRSSANLSNYLPFFFGVNVLFDNFPANPTTWYIGTYLHLLLFWCFFLRGKAITKAHIFFALFCEILIRSLILASGKAYIAYMLLPNWLTVFLLGMYLAQKQDADDTSKLIFLVPAWIGFFAFWSFISNAIGFDTSFPFRKMANDFSYATVTRSILIALIYCTHTLLFFAIARRLPSLRLVSFFARNTLIIFILHMPLVFGCSAFVYSLITLNYFKKPIWILTLYVGLAILSEGINKGLNITALREKIWGIITSMLNIPKTN